MHLEQASFTALLITENGFDPGNFKSWVFHPGMLFTSPDKWWGDFGQRNFPHEGIDLCLYRDAGGRVNRLGANTRIPVMHDGVVKALLPDFLGHAVILEHQSIQDPGGKLMSVYAHTKPEENIVPGTAVKAGDVIATIADTSRSKANILPHLHFSFGYPFSPMAYDPFVWNSMRDPQKMRLHDPLCVMDRPCQVMDAGDRTGLL